MLRILALIIGLAWPFAAAADITIQPTSFPVPPSYVEDELNTPPGSPTIGLCWLAGAAPTGAWATHATHIACRRSSDWAFYVPAAGWQLQVEDVDLRFVFDGSTWSSQAGAGGGDFASTDCTDCTSLGRSLMTPPNAAAARTAIGAVIGTNVQAWSSELDDLAAVDLSTIAGASVITRIATGAFSGETVLGSLATGLLKNATTTGTLSIAAAATDYIAPGGAAVVASLSVNGGATLTALTAAGFSGGSITVTNNVNTDSVTVGDGQILRVGNRVTVTGAITIDATATGNTSFDMSLPIASNLSASGQAAGVASNGLASGRMLGVSADDTIQIFYSAVSTASQTWSYSYTYSVL